MIFYHILGIALGNESLKFHFSYNSTNAVSIHKPIWYPVDIFFYHHLTIFLDILPQQWNCTRRCWSLWTIFSTADHFEWRVYILSWAWALINFSHHLCWGISLKNYSVYWYVLKEMVNIFSLLWWSIGCFLQKYGNWNMSMLCIHLCFTHKSIRILFKLKSCHTKVTLLNILAKWNWSLNLCILYDWTEGLWFTNI